MEKQINKSKNERICICVPDGLFLKKEMSVILLKSPMFYS